MKNVRIELKKNDYSMIKFGQNFHFSDRLFLDGNEENVPDKHQTKKHMYS